ncbi:hypothetical protein ACWD5V_09405 [Streptomyces sp. NPDC002523]
MNHRPYPDVARALRQMKRRHAFETQSPLLAWIDEHLCPGLTEWQKPLVVAAVKRTGKAAITAAIVDQGVKASQHVHFATRDGVRCASGAPACSLPSKEPSRCVIVASNEIDQKGRA